MNLKKNYTEKKYLLYENQKYVNYFSKKEKTKFGKIYVLNEEKYNKNDDNKIEQKTNDNNDNRIIMDELNKYNIEFLIKIYFYFEELNYKIKESFNENQKYELKIGFVINHNLIERYNNFYQYN